MGGGGSWSSCSAARTAAAAAPGTPSTRASGSRRPSARTRARCGRGCIRLGVQPPRHRSAGGGWGPGHGGTAQPISRAPPARSRGLRLRSPSCASRSAAPIVLMMVRYSLERRAWAPPPLPRRRVARAPAAAAVPRRAPLRPAPAARGAPPCAGAARRGCPVAELEPRDVPCLAGHPCAGDRELVAISRALRRCAEMHPTLCLARGPPGGAARPAAGWGRTGLRRGAGRAWQPIRPWRLGSTRRQNDPAARAERGREREREGTREGEDEKERGRERRAIMGRASLLVASGLTVCFAYPVLCRVSAQSRAGEWEL